MKLLLTCTGALAHHEQCAPAGDLVYDEATRACLQPDIEACCHVDFGCDNYDDEAAEAAAYYSHLSCGTGSEAADRYSWYGMEGEGPSEVFWRDGEGQLLGLRVDTAPCCEGVVGHGLLCGEIATCFAPTMLVGDEETPDPPRCELPGEGCATGPIPAAGLAYALSLGCDPEHRVHAARRC